MVWDSCLQTIRRMVPDQSFKTWFEPIRPVSLRDNSLVIQVPNRFFYEWLEEHYVGILKHTIRPAQVGTSLRQWRRHAQPYGHGSSHRQSTGLQQRHLYAAGLH